MSETATSPAGVWATTPLRSTSYTALWTYWACASVLEMPLYFAAAGAQAPRSTRFTPSSLAYADSSAAAARMLASGRVRTDSSDTPASRAPSVSRSPRRAIRPYAADMPSNSSAPCTISKRVSV